MRSCLMALREELNHDGNEYAFTDDEILGPFG
ncbi:mannitol operon repressor [Escherichia coli]|uniref:Mannitol operon repressor n=1 Tax=Escherichia coli TaxID=562 RepID=A0A2X3JY15_ECOLX|nr:mannitol operon repressor [Escherichia coli]